MKIFILVYFVGVYPILELNTYLSRIIGNKGRILKVSGSVAI